MLYLVMARVLVPQKREASGGVDKIPLTTPQGLSVLMTFGLLMKMGVRLGSM